MDSKVISIREALKKSGLMAPLSFGSDVDAQKYYDTGLVLRPEDLEVGEEYTGISRAAYTGLWNGSAFEVVVDGVTIPLNHFSNYDGTDVFIPVIIKD